MSLASIRHRLTLKRGNDLLRRERWHEAAPLLGRAVKLAPAHWESHNNLAVALLKLERWEDALGVAAHAIALNPRSSESHALFGIALLKLERWEEAIAAYRRAIEVDPDRYDAHERLGMALTRLERWPEVVGAYERALALDPSRASAHNVLGMALLKLGRVEDAVAAFQRAIDLVSNDAAASEDLAGFLINLASAVAKLDHSREAVETLRRAAALEPSAAARLSLAVELLKLGQWEQGEQELARGSALAPTLGGFHFLRVDPLVKLGRLKEAVAAYRQALAGAGPRPPLPGDPASARFDRNRMSFWTPENLGADAFAAERWLTELVQAPAIADPPARRERLMFVLDNDYGELTTVMYFVLGQSLARRTTLMLGERLYANNANAIPGQTYGYRSLEDVIRIVDREKPDIVFLCSGYLFTAHHIFTPEVLQQLIQQLRERGCRVVTSDPFLGMLSKQDPRTMISIDIPMVHPVWTAEQLTKAKRGDEERMWAYFSQSERILRDTYHLYPSYCDVPSAEAVRTDTRNLAFFNEQLVRAPSPSATRESSKPHWLFVLASADYDTQLLFEGEAGFADIVATKLLEALAAGRHPIMIAPSQFVEKLVERMPTTEGIDLLTHCPFQRFMSLLLSAEHAFYWNVVSHSILIRLYNQLPVVLFDRGHLVRNARAVYDRIVAWYYQGSEPQFHSHRDPLTLEAVEAWTAGYRRNASTVAERFRRAPAPEQMIADLMARDPIPSV